jgi:hypothetical protein
MELGAGNQTVLVAQAHDPLETRADLLGQPDGAVSAVGFPLMRASGSYTVQIVCLGDATMEYDIRTTPGSRPGRTMTCDGTLTSETIDAGGPGSLVLFFREPLRWRVVVRGEPVAVPLPTSDPEPLTADVGMEELVRLDNQTTDSSDEWGHTLLMLQETQPVPGRFDYHAQLWCEPGNDLRLILGDQLEGDGDLTADTETYVRCDGLPMDLELRTVHPDGSRVFVAAAPGARWSLLITSEMPPVRVIDDLPDWLHSTSYGPSYGFEQHDVSFSNSGADGGRPLLVGLECAGPTQQIEVTVDLTAPFADDGQRFFAECAPGGVRTNQLYDTATGYSVRFHLPAGVWVAATALIQNP